MRQQPDKIRILKSLILKDLKHNQFLSKKETRAECGFHKWVGKTTFRTYY